MKKSIMRVPLTNLLVVLGTAVSLSACSTSMSRFSSVLGYNDSASDMGTEYSGSSRTYRGSSSNNSRPPSYSSNDDFFENGDDGYPSSYNRPKPVKRQKLSRLHTDRPRKPRRLREHDFNNEPSRKNRVYLDRSNSQENRYSNQNTGTGNSVVVRSGDTLYGISRRYGVRMHELMEVNNLNDSTIRIGQVLTLPTGSAATNGYAGTRTGRTNKAPEEYQNSRSGSWVDDVSGNTGQASVKNPGNQLRADESFETASTGSAQQTPGGRSFRENSYVVQSGDTLFSIARYTGASYQAIANANALDENFTVRVGQRLNIPDQDALGSSNPARDNNSRNPVLAERRSNASTYQVPTETYRKPEPELKKQASLTNEPMPRYNQPKKAGSLSLRWPARGRIISKFGSKEDGKNNDGINLAIPAGTEVLSAETGVVAYAGSELAGYGNLILIRHADNWVTAYAHNRDLKVKRGDRVRRGEVIALAGNSGNVDQPQLHFELRKGSKPVNPMEYLAKR